MFVTTCAKLRETTGRNFQLKALYSLLDFAAEL